MYSTLNVNYHGWFTFLNCLKIKKGLEFNLEEKLRWGLKFILTLNGVDIINFTETLTLAEHQLWLLIMLGEKF